MADDVFYHVGQVEQSVTARMRDYRIPLDLRLALWIDATCRSTRLIVDVYAQYWQITNVVMIEMRTVRVHLVV